MKTKKYKGKPRGMSYADVLEKKRMIRESVQRAANDATVKVRSDTATQRALWLAVVSIADAYGFGAKRMEPFFAAFDANSEELERMRTEVDEDYAYEKLRLKAERVTGMEIAYLYAHEAQAAESVALGGKCDAQ